MEEAVQQDANTIALMTVMETKILHSKSSRFLYLLFLFILFNCSNKSESHIASSILSKNIVSKKRQNDSLEITIQNIPANTTANLMYNDFDLNSKNIYFENKSHIPQTVTKKILKPTNFDYTILYRTFTMIDNKLQTYYRDYFIKRSADHLEFLFNEKNGDIELLSHNKEVYEFDDITKGYQKITGKNNHYSITEKIKKIEMLHLEYKNQFTDSIHQSINDLIFYKQLSLLSPNDKRIETYLKTIVNPVWSTDLLGTIYQYLKANKENIHKLELDKNNNSVFNKLMEIGVNNHLQQFKDKKYPDYQKNLEWFKKTDYYTDHKSESDKGLALENEPVAAKNNLFSFNLHHDKKIIKLENVISTRKSQYYLLDFWATWCAPCLQNIETMHHMDLPKELEIIYISMDRTADKDKWIKKSENFKLENSYLFVEDDNNKKIIKKISLDQLPRYILIDKDLNILNFNLPTPQESDFLKELNLFMKNK